PDSDSGDCVDSSWGAPFPPEICNLATNTYSEYHYKPGLPFDICCNCGDPDCCAGDPDCDCCSTEDDLEANQCLPPVLAERSDEVPYPENVYIKKVQDEQFWLEEKKWEDGEEPYTEYDRTMPFGACTMYIEGSNDEDAGFHLGRLAEYTLSELGVVIRIFKRLDDLMYNNSCSNSSMLYTIDYSPSPYFLPYYFHDKQG